MQRRSPFWERWPTPIWFCILFPVLNFASHECFPSIKFWKALSDGANMILLWTKKERVEFLLMFVFSYILPPAWSFCSYWPTMQLQRDSMCINFNRQSNWVWIEMNSIEPNPFQLQSVDSGRLNSINKHPARQVYDRGNLNDHIRISNSEDGD